MNNEEIIAKLKENAVGFGNQIGVSIEDLNKALDKARAEGKKNQIANIELNEKMAYDKGYEKGHQEGWDDACSEYEIDEETSKSVIKQLADIDVVLARRTAIDNIPNRVDKILFMLSELEKAGRQSALVKNKEMEQTYLGWYLDAIEKELSKHNTASSNIMNIITHVQYRVFKLEQKLKDKDAEKQEQVRKLLNDLDEKLERLKINIKVRDVELQQSIGREILAVEEFKRRVKDTFPDCADNCQEGKFCAKHGVTHIKEEVIK